MRIRLHMPLLNASLQSMLMNFQKDWLLSVA